jgi:hypothetical protein
MSKRVARPRWRKNENRAVAMFDFVAIRTSFGVDCAMVKFVSNRAMLRLEMRFFSEDSKLHAGRERRRRHTGLAPATASVSEVFVVIVKQGTVADFDCHCISVEIPMGVAATSVRWRLPPWRVFNAFDFQIQF